MLSNIVSLMNYYSNSARTSSSTYHLDSAKQEQGNPAQIGNRSQILGKGAIPLGLMSKSGRLCSHCGLGALSKTLTGGSAGGKDPRRDQREREGYWARSPTHTNTHPSTCRLRKHKPTTYVTNSNTERQTAVVHKETQQKFAFVRSPNIYTWADISHANKQRHQHKHHTKTSQGGSEKISLSHSTSSIGKFSHMATHRGPTSGSLARLTACSSQNQLDL